MDKNRTDFTIDELMAFLSFCTIRASNPDFGAADAYDRVRSTFPHIKQIEDHLRTIARAFGIQVTGRRYIPDRDCAKTLRRLQHVISSFQELDKGPVQDVITVAGSPSLMPYFGTEVVRQFQADRRKDDQHFADKFEFHLAQGLPHELIGNALHSNEYDLIITSCDQHNTRFPWSDFEWELLELPMYLMFDRRHPFAEMDPRELTWESLGEMTVIIQDQNRDPPPPYPNELFASPCRKVRFPSYQDAYATVLCGGNVACIGFPQLLAPFQRVRLTSVSNNRLNLQKMPLVLLLNQRAQRNCPGEERAEVIGQLRDFFRTRLRSNEATNVPGDLSRALGIDLRTTWNVGKGNGGRYIWKRGLIKNLEVTPAGEFNADHSIELFEGQPREEFTIQGRITENSQGEYQMTWHGSKRFTRSPDENYQAIVIAESGVEMKKGPLFGRWFGRTSAEPGYREDMGFFVIVGNDWTCDPVELENKCRQRIGGLSWRYPLAD